MRKIFYVLATTVLLAGCTTDSDIAVTGKQLQHQQFTLESVNGHPVTKSEPPMTLNFGETSTLFNHIKISGTLCNNFTGTATISGGQLTASGVVMTRKLCSDKQRNQLDTTLIDMLRQGAQVDLTETQLTLATAEQTLVYTQTNK